MLDIVRIYLLMVFALDDDVSWREVIDSFVRTQSVQETIL